MKKSNTPPPAAQTRGNEKKRIAVCCALAAAATLVCCGIAYTICGVFPFGGSHRLYADMVIEYVPFLSELHDKLRGGGSLFYSWATGFGGSFWGSFCYYLLSPLNILLMLLPKAALTAGAELFIPLRQCLASAAMALFLCKRKNGAAGLPAVWFGAAYGACGWFLAYSFNIIWLDVFLLLPLLALGIERLIETGKTRAYALVFALMLVSNFYMSIFAAEFAVFYFITYYFSHHSFSEPFPQTAAEKSGFFSSRFWRTGLRFAGASVVSAAALGVLFVPLVLLAAGGAAQNLYAESAAKYFADLPRQAASLFSGGAPVNVTNAQYLPVYSGVLTLAGAALFPFLTKIPKKERALTLGALLFFVLCFNLPFLDTLMHGARTVTGMYFRYSFLFSFFLIAAAHRAITVPEKPAKKATLFAAAALTVLTALAAGYTFFNHENENTVAMSPAVFFTNLLLLVMLSACAFLRPHIEKRGLAAALSAVLSVAVAFDLTFAQCIHPRVMPGEDYTELNGVFDAAQEMLRNTNDTEPFFRTDLRSINNAYGDYGSRLGVKGLYQSASVTETNYAFWRNMGLDTNMSNYILNNLQTPAFNSLFGVKYIVETDAYLTQDDTPNSLSDSAAEGYMKIADNGAGARLYRYAWALPAGFAANRDVTGWTPAENAAPENQNAFFRLAAGADGILTDAPLSAPTFDPAAVTVDKKENGAFGFSFNEENESAQAVTFTVTPETSGQLYVYLNVETKRNQAYTLVVKKPDNTRRIYSYDVHTTMTSVGYAPAGQTFTLEFYCNPGATGAFTLQTCISDPAALQAAYNTLRQKGFWALDKATDTRLSGKITVNGADQIFCTSIPVSKGWTVTVDGETLPKERLLAIGGALLGFEIAPGTHEVSVEYHLPGLGAGIAVSCIGIAAALVWASAPRIRKRKSKDVAVSAPQKA